MTKVRTAVLLSGSGSNFGALADAAAADPHFPADISLVISNKPGVLGLERARAHNIRTQTIDHKEYSSREAFDDAMQAALDAADIEFICLAGFMRILTPDFVTHWNGRMLNIHPSLLPAFRGNRAHEQVLDSTVTISGCTVHAVTPDLDAGPIVAQAAVPRKASDALPGLAGRVQVAEHLIYPWAVRAFLRSSDESPAYPKADDILFSLNPNTRYAPKPV